MKAREALKLANEYKDPKNLKETLEQIEAYAYAGFTNAEFYYKKEEAEILKLHDKLVDLGYQVFIAPALSKGYTYSIEVQWDRVTNECGAV